MIVLVRLNGERTVVSTLAGGVSGTNGAYIDASGTNAGFNLPWGLAVDANGNVFVGDFNNQRIRKVTAAGGTRIGPNNLRVRCAIIYSSVCPPSMFFDARAFFWIPSLSFFLSVILMLERDSEVDICGQVFLGLERW